DSMLHAGTAIAGGRGRAIVVATGRETEFGKIASALTAEEPPTPLQVELDRVGRRLAVLALATAGLVFLTGVLRGNPVEAMLLTAVALAVAAIPEGLPAVVTITLSRGVQRMADRNAIVRRLPAVEALGAASVICTDKTGTLTRNEIRLQRIRMAGYDLDPADLDVVSDLGRAFVDVAVLCNDGRRGDDDWVGDPTETSLLHAIETAGGDVEGVRASLPRLDEIAFDSSRKRMTTIHPRDGGYLVATKGAPEIVLDRCSTVLDAAGAVPLDDARRHSLAEIAVDLASSGLRTLALARRTVGRLPSELDLVETELELVAIVGMSDAVRDEAPDAVASARRAGITVVMVTGDHEVTARAVAREVGIIGDGDEVMAGDRLRSMSVDELAAEVDRYRVYARIDPLDKVKIVDAWQQRGEIVAMTGDGVNDAPALQAADIGVAMGSGTDVAKGAASMILADDDFATIVAAVREGRSIFSNLRTVVSYLLSCNVSEVIVMLLGFLVFGALGDPLLAVQLLWINLVTDGLPALALGVDAPEEGTMARPPDRSRNILSARRQLTLLGLGSILAAAALGTLVIGHYALGEDWEVVRTMVFTTLVVVQLAHAWSMRQRAAGRMDSRPEPNRLLLGAAAVSFGLQLLVVVTPLGRTLFETTLVPMAGWGVIAGLTALSWAAIGGVAMVRRSRGRTAGSRQGSADG
ncbi:MAG TPA: cation-translocating P-type ATPase, partial [Acidimicrobiia bacterium]|nr:cation-translocating P-type ATPase [Acidimicrobiia bacterium]